MSNVWPWHVRGFDSRHSHGMHPKYEKQNCWLHHHYWFVVCLRLWKIWLRQLGLFFPTEWKNKKCSKPPTRLYPVVFCYRKKQNTFWWLNTSFPCANLFGHPPPLIPMAHESYACMYICLYVFIDLLIFLCIYLPVKSPLYHSHNPILAGSTKDCHRLRCCRSAQDGMTCLVVGHQLLLLFAHHGLSEAETQGDVPRLA